MLCYQVALSGEYAANWADEGQPDLWTVWASETDVKSRLKSAIYTLKEEVGASWAVVVVTQDSENFRKTLLPSYKENRSSNRKPIMLSLLRKYCVDHFEGLSDPRLEADDILGILQTGGEFAGQSVPEGHESLIVSGDKDMKTIPGLHLNIERRREGVFEISQDAADEFHMIQALAGDITDNYAGCPGIGMERAKRIIKERIAVRSFEHVFKSGPRKGLSETRWEEYGAEDLWHSVRTHYEKAGLTEEDALVQARCARILRSSDYVNGEVKLWEP